MVIFSPGGRGEGRGGEGGSNMFACLDLIFGCSKISFYITHSLLSWWTGIDAWDIIKMISISGKKLTCSMVVS